MKDGSFRANGHPQMLEITSYPKDDQGIVCGISDRLSLTGCTRTVELPEVISLSNLMKGAN